MSTSTESSTETAVSPAVRVDSWLAAFSSALAARDVEAAANLFASTCFWRDLVSFSWNLTTVEGRDGVAGLLGATLEATDPSGFATTQPPDEADGVTTAWIEFETATGRARGLLRLIEEDGEPRAWTLLTSLRELKGYEEQQGENRPQGVSHELSKGRASWQEEREAEAEELGYGRQPYVVVIGGGQAGIVIGARLRQRRTSRRSPVPTCSPGSSSTPRSTPGRRPTGARRSWWSARTTPPSTPPTRPT